MPLIELNLEGLERVRKDEMTLVELDLAGDLELLYEKLSTGRTRMIGLHLEDALTKYHNKFMVSLAMHEIERYLRSMYRQVGYSFSPQGEKWSIPQVDAQRIMKELDGLVPKLGAGLQSKLDMSKVLASYQMQCGKLSPAAGEHVKQCAVRLSEGKLRECAVLLFKARKDLARAILKGI